MATDIIQHTRRLQPRHGEPPVPGAKPESGDDDAQQMISWLAQGVPPTVGQMVLKAVEENRLYVHTDRIMYAGTRTGKNRFGSIRDIRDGRTPQSSTIHQPSGSADCANSTPVKSIARVARFSLDVPCRNAFML